MDFYQLLHHRAQDMSQKLHTILGSLEVGPQVQDVLEYAISSPGKRIRSIMVLWASELFMDQADDNTMVAAASIEMVHTYSLIHDDLPAMDDDDFRRGRPSCHKAFDEAIAILAGDALLTLAFELLADRVKPAPKAVHLVRELARAAGPAGMIAGQVADLKAEKAVPDAQVLQYIHTNKTAKMFRCAALMGGICGQATVDELDHLAEYGLKVGLGFQIRDDILDMSQPSDKLGKTAGKDQRDGKMTYPALLGIDRAEAYAKELSQDAISHIDRFGPRSDRLRQLALALLERDR
jgi:geranylgeranyl diphosphate synthase, type II